MSDPDYTNAIERHLAEMFTAEDAYGAGFYDDGNWQKHYNALRMLAGYSESFYRQEDDKSD